MIKSVIGSHASQSIATTDSNIEQVSTHGISTEIKYCNGKKTAHFAVNE